jgi:hypothetical protein
MELDSVTPEVLHRKLAAIYTNVFFRAALVLREASREFAVAL